MENKRTDCTDRNTLKVNDVVKVTYNSYIGTDNDDCAAVTSVSIIKKIGPGQNEFHFEDILVINFDKPVEPAEEWIGDDDEITFDKLLFNYKPATPETPLEILKDKFPEYAL